MTTKLAKKEETALASSEVNAMFGGGDQPQIPVDAPLPQIKILRETPMYEMPDGTTQKEFTGHILYYHNANQLYTEAYGEGDGIPTCASSDGIIPDGGSDALHGPCRGCEMNQFGSAEDGRAKACANTIRLYVLLDGDILPCILKAPPSSLGRKESLMRWLTNAPNLAAKNGLGVKYQPIKVRFMLHKKDFASGMSASVIDLETVRVLHLEKPEDMEKLQSLARLYNDFMTHYVGRIRKDVAEDVDPEYETAKVQYEAGQKDQEIPI